MSETIITKFDPSVLPAWAQDNPAVVARCERDLAYRCDVCSAKHATMRQLLIKRATANPAAVALGRLGGKSTSPAKGAAARANSAARTAEQKGGRPRKSA